MTFVDSMVILSTVLVAGTGTVMIGVAVRGYRRAPSSTMLHLAVGFTLIVASTLSATISLLLQAYVSTTLLLVVKNLLAMAGLLVILYGLLVHDPTRQTLRIT